jgi:hypothetical protein
MQITLYALNKVLVVVFICFYKIVYHHSAVNVLPILNIGYFTRLLLDFDFVWRINSISLTWTLKSHHTLSLHYILF